MSERTSQSRHSLLAIWESFLYDENQVCLRSSKTPMHLVHYPFSAHWVYQIWQTFVQDLAILIDRDDVQLIISNSENLL